MRFWKVYMRCMHGEWEHCWFPLLKLTETVKYCRSGNIRCRSFHRQYFHQVTCDWITDGLVDRFLVRHPLVEEHITILLVLFLEYALCFMLILYVIALTLLSTFYLQNLDILCTSSVCMETPNAHLPKCQISKRKIAFIFTLKWLKFIWKSDCYWWVGLCVA